MNNKNIEKMYIKLYINPDEIEIFKKTINNTLKMVQDIGNKEIIQINKNILFRLNNSKSSDIKIHIYELDGLICILMLYAEKYTNGDNNLMKIIENIVDILYPQYQIYIEDIIEFLNLKINHRMKYLKLAKGVII